MWLQSWPDPRGNQSLGEGGGTLEKLCTCQALQRVEVKGRVGRDEGGPGVTGHCTRAAGGDRLQNALGTCKSVPLEQSSVETAVPSGMVSGGDK